MRIVIDTNVLISAILRDRTPEAVILFSIESPNVEWIASTAIVAEYVGVISRPKFKLPPDLIQQWVQVFEASITMITPTEIIDFPRDPKDSKFLNCILEGQTDHFITGDRDFSEVPEQVRSLICSVNQ
ncbi:MAG: putative toxin-antitoxin system toxin component, PIN family [Alkalinema sp. CAN_BIN05]|nr:putative toxin-antitoxin system toxin component, PIN family [Alkalinema sp. CAN_BIN05]